MVAETDRVYANIRIITPDGTSVLFPVITQISFIDPVDRYQETRYTIDNSGNADRDVHIAWVGDGQNANETEDADPDAQVPDDVLAVQRIDRWKILDAVERNQETQIAPDNRTKDKNGPPYFTTHLKTHVLRVVNDPDDGSWIETEVIDQISILDPVDRNQETIITLQNPAGEPDGEGNLIYKADKDDPTIDAVKPYKTDPFQNIVKVSSGAAVVFFEDHS